MKHPVRRRSTPWLRALLLALAWSGLAFVPPSWAAEEPLGTDRPDFVESSDVVGPRHFQIETGVVFERDSAAGVTVRARTTPTLLRFGIDDHWEARLETDGFAHTRTTDAAGGPSADQSGFSDLSLGVKWHVHAGDEEAGVPGIAWLANLDLASGTRAFRGQGLRPSLRFVAEWDLPYELSVGVMPGLYVDKTDTGHRFVGGIFAVTLAKALGPAWHAFVELAGQQIAAGRNGGTVATLDTGAAYLVNDDLQLDVSLNRGLNDNSPDLQWGLGLSVRF